jgi:hypothetical protein
MELRDGRPLVSREKANERGQAYTLDKERQATAKGQKQATEQATDRRIAGVVARAAPLDLRHLLSVSMIAALDPSDRAALARQC